MDPNLTALAVDVAKGTILERVVDPLVKPVWEAIKPVLYPWWDPALHEIRLNLSEAADELAAKDAAAVEALARSLERGEADALLTLFLREASQATTAERMRMLSAAASGVFSPDLTSETRSRVARAVVELEPSDVLLLRGVEEASLRRAGPEHREESVFIKTTEGTAELQKYTALIQAGAILTIGVYDGESLEMTPLGRAVLQCLRKWPRTRAGS